ISCPLLDIKPCRSFYIVGWIPGVSLTCCLLSHSFDGRPDFIRCSTFHFLMIYLTELPGRFKVLEICLYPCLMSVLPQLCF
ncbi:hypothetical protein LDENG_00194760, partial [Lucifuga dentata]